MSKQSGLTKSKMQKIIAAVVIVLVLIVVLVVVLATRKPKKEEPVAEITTEAVTESESEGETEGETKPNYDYTMKLDMNKVKEAHEKNPDVVGWVYVDGTEIDYPIVQSDDNDEYMTIDWEKNSARGGSIFADYRSGLLEAENTLIYGHNMASSPRMFHELKNYQDEDWGKDHLFVEFATLDKRYLCEVFSADIIDGLQGSEFEYWNFVQMAKDDYNNFLDLTKKFSVAWYADKGVDDMPSYDDGDKIITLQTCENGTDDGQRCVVFAKVLQEQ